MKTVKNKGKDIIGLVLSAIIPIQNEAADTEKKIKVISLLIGGLFIFQLFKDFEMIRFMLTDSEVNWDFSTILFFLPLIILPVAALLFFKHNKIGWTLLSGFLAYSVVNAAGLFIVILNMQPSGNPALDNMLPYPSMLVPIFTFFFLGGMLSTLCTQNMRKIYAIDKSYMLVTIGFTVLATALTIYGLFM